ncbi:putative 1 4-beta-D-glucan cellobiohydrolase A [Bienertia sinuspersici]
MLQQWDPELAEASAAKCAVEVAENEGWRNVILEGDAMSVRPISSTNGGRCPYCL